MAEEIFLIKIKEASSPRAIKQLSEVIHREKGRVLFVSDKGYSFIVNLESSYREAIQARPEVELIGGVQLRPRTIRRIQVSPSGRNITPQPREEGA